MCHLTMLTNSRPEKLSLSPNKMSTSTTTKHPSLSRRTLQNLKKSKFVPFTLNSDIPTKARHYTSVPEFDRTRHNLDHFLSSSSTYGSTKDQENQNFPQRRNFRKPYLDAKSYQKNPRKVVKTPQKPLTTQSGSCLLPVVILHPGSAFGMGQMDLLSVENISRICRPNWA